MTEPLQPLPRAPSAGSREVGMLLFLVALLAAPAFCGEGARFAFYKAMNLAFLARHVAMLSLFAIGVTFVIVAGGIDLSLGSLIAFSGVLCAYGLDRMGLPAWAVIGATLVVGAIVGLCHGFLVVHVGVPPFVATLGTMCMLRSLAMLLTSSVSITIRDAAFLALGKVWQADVPFGAEHVLRIHFPAPVLVLLPVVAASVVLMHATTYGRYLYAVGSNEEATRLSGVRTGRIKYLAYVLSSVLASAAGIVYASYSRVGDPSSGRGYELSAIAAAVIGGCSLAGGEGSVTGTLVGACILHVILNELNLIIKHNASLWEGAIVGVVVIAAVALNTLRQRRRR